MVLTTSGIFAVACLGVVVPVFLVSTVWFWVRRGLQPIKSRRPGLVVFTDAVLLLFVVFVCAQRIIGDDYPCYLNLWSGFVGAILLCNAYLVRCWLLYYDYRLTQARVRHYRDDGLDPESFPVRYRAWSDLGYISRRLLVVSVLLLAPALVITLSRQNDIVDGTGDDCDKGWADAVIAVYVCIYVVIFSSLAWRLRQVVDGFFIKEELRISGIVALLAVGPWLLFNTLFESANEDIFPFSTAVVVVAVAAAFTTSTIWPLYRSIYHPAAAAQNLDVPERIDNLRGLLSYPQGYESFKKFLATEFSVENLLFYSEVEYYRGLVAELPPSSPDLVKAAHQIYSKYTAASAPFEVNLPGATASKLKADMKEMFQVSARTLPVMDEEAARASNEDIPMKAIGARSSVPDGLNRPSAASRAGAKPSSASSAAGGGDDQEEANALLYDPPTIFDAASREIYHLMETDSYQRYVLTPQYRELLQEYENTIATLQAMVDLNQI